MRNGNTRSFPRSRLATALFAVLMTPVLAHGQETQQEPPSSSSPPATTEGARTLDKVTVTGSRIKRVDVEGPAPVVVVTAADIEKEGSPPSMTR